MSRSTRRGRLSCLVLWSIAALGVAASVACAYVVFGPGPTDFAGGKQATLDSYRDADPTGVPARLKSASLVERGEYLTRAADCVVCHTAKDRAPFAGGLAFVLPFGTLYLTNITPDKQTGIGKYTDRDFLAAVHKGVGRDGAALYPAMPYPSYTYMSNAPNDGAARRPPSNIWILSLRALAADRGPGGGGCVDRTCANLRGLQ